MNDDNAFAKYENEAWPYRFDATLRCKTPLAGGTPRDPKVAEGWLRSKLADQDDLIRSVIAELMVEEHLTEDEATAEAVNRKHLKGFKRDPERGLFIEGRTVKAAIKEAASIARAVGKLNKTWGETNKGVLSFVAEHIQVDERRIYLGVQTPSGVDQRFVSVYRGQGIGYTEYVEDAEVNFTVRSDHDFSEREWAMIWLTGGENGLGADRSLGFGKYTVVRWDRIEAARPKRLRNVLVAG